MNPQQNAPSVNFSLFGNLNTILGQLQTQLANLAFTVAAVMVIIALMEIMLAQDMSPTAQNQRWHRVRLILICAGGIAAVGVVIAFAKSVGGAI